MNDKELLSQLNKIKNLQPDSNWKEKNRDLLLSQIYGSEVSEHRVEFNLPGAIGRMFSSCILRSITQPVMAVILIIAFLLCGGILSLNASRDTKPGDSLYIAKIINEKAQIAFTFDEKKKAQLGLDFASNRAEELDQILAGENNQGKNDKVEKLVSNFKKEISGVKSRLEKIAKEEGSDSNSEEEAFVFSANIEKEENGIQISISDTGLEDNALEIDQEVAIDESENQDTALDLPKESEVLKEVFNNPKQIIAEAKNLLNKEDYNGTLNRLEEADKAISQMNPEEDQNVEEAEQATSTEENISEEDDSGEILGAEEAVTAEEDSATSTEESN